MERLKDDEKSTLFKRIIKLGIIKEKHSLNEKKLISLFNISCIVWHALTTISTIVYLFITPVLYIKIYLNIAMSAVILITQIIHSKQYFNLGRTLFLLFLIFFAFVNSNYIRPGSFYEFFLLLIPGFSLISFDNKYLVGFIFIISFSVFSIPNIFYQNYPLTTLYSPSMICLFSALYLMFYYFKKNNKQNEQLLAIERDKVLSDKIILEKQEAKLRELNEFKTHFFVNLSHEIRTPITLIKGYASKIDFDQTKQENEPKLAIVNKQITQIENIINNILDLSKLDENKLKLYRSNIDIILFLNKHYAEFKALFIKKNITFSFTNTIAKTNVYMDTNLVAKAITNLLSNALKFTQEGGKVNITVSQEKHLFIQVTDSGLGIPEADIERVFERFYQSKNHITKSQGSGIGLSFSKSILKAHGFSIAVKSIPKISTTFTITIPEEYISTEEVADAVIFPTIPQNIKTSLVSVPTNTRDMPTILIVDDHQELRHYLKTVLNAYNLIEAKDGEEALAIIQNNTAINMVVTDYMMPKMDGKALVTEIKKLGITIPILVLTARVDDFAKLDMLRIGVDNYMIKPFIDEELLLSIDNSLSIYKKIIANQKQLSLEEKEELYDIDDDFHISVRKIIESNIADFNFGIDDIALFFKVSKSTLNRKIKNSLGQTTKELIMHAKVEKARELQLKNPKMTKKNIATDVGIKNTTYLFNKLAETYGTHYL